MHAGKPGTPSLRVEYRDGQLCRICHQDQQGIVNSDHDMRVTAPDSQNLISQTPQQAGVCGSCHSMHRAREKTAFLSVAEKAPVPLSADDAPGNDRCLNCHRKQGIAKDAVVEQSGHPWRDLVLRSDKAVMPLVNPAGKNTEFGRIACITCHEPHHWSRGRDQPPLSTTKKNAKNHKGNVLNSFLRLNRLKGTFCVDCHGLESRIKFKYYHDRISRDAGIGYIK
jgi:hypothetical protein